MKVLMVCLGNICRSPLAEGILRKKIEENNLDWTVDSAGTGSWHIGEIPHKESIEVAKKNGIDITNQKARLFNSKDLENFDLILAMDSENMINILSKSASESQTKKVELILNYSLPGSNMAVPDPYYTGNFDLVYKLLDKACDDVLIKHK